MPSLLHVFRVGTRSYPDIRAHRAYVALRSTTCYFFFFSAELRFLRDSKRKLKYEKKEPGDCQHVNCTLLTCIYFTN